MANKSGISPSFRTNQPHVGRRAHEDRAVACTKTQTLREKTNTGGDSWKLENTNKQHCSHTVEQGRKQENKRTAQMVRHGEAPTTKQSVKRSSLNVRYKTCHTERGHPRKTQRAEMCLRLSKHLVRKEPKEENKNG